MLLSIVRDPPGNSSILGTISVDGIFLAHTRENLMRSDGMFVSTETGLPCGLYNLSMDYCRRFKTKTPLLVATYSGDRRRVSGRIGMRISPGHSSDLTAFESHGEILIGLERDGRSVIHTRPAYELLVSRITQAMHFGEAIECEISAPTT